MKSKSKDKINLLDVTLREGAYILDTSLKDSQIVDIIAYLAHAKIEYCEIPYKCLAQDPSSPPTESDLALLETIKKSNSNIKIGTLINTSWTSIRDLDLISPFIDFIRIGTHISEIESASRLIEKAKKYNLLTFFQMMRTPSVSPLKAAVAAKKVEKMGAEIIYIVDTMGSLVPQKVKEYVKTIKNAVKTPLGFHAHNNLGLAISNSLEAVKAGCKWVDASLLGVGRQAGNTQLETLLLLLQKEGHLKNIDSEFLLNMAESLIAPLFNAYKGIDPYDIWAAHWNLDLYPRWVYEKISLLVGLDTKTFIKELAQIKGFTTLNEDSLIEISKKFNIPYEILSNAIQSPPLTLKSAQNNASRY